jgi:hypothetical protein
MAMLKVEMAPIVIPLLLIAAPTLADVTSELARCELEAERLFPPPHNKGAQNWSLRAANLQKRAENIEMCMRAVGYSATAECAAPLKTYESCMKIADEIMRGPSRSQIMTLIGTKFAWIMNGTCGPRNGYQRAAISPEVGGAGWAGE